MAKSSRSTYVLLQVEPRSWLAKLYEEIIDILWSDADRFSVSSQVVGTMEHPAVLREVQLLSEKIGLGGDVLHAEAEPEFFDVFKAAAIVAKSAVLLEDGNTLFEAKNAGYSTKVALTEAQVNRLKSWSQAHGDAFRTIFRPESSLKPRPQPIGVRLKAGESFVIPADEVPQEFRAGVLDLGAVEKVGDCLTVQGRVPRLIPNSGLFGRMGRYDVTLEIPKAASYVVHDPGELRVIPVTVGHFDPVEQLLHLGSPEAGHIEVVTASSDYRVTLGSEPAQIRRWRRWFDA